MIKHHQLQLLVLYFKTIYEVWGALEPRLANARIRGDNLMGFGVDRLPIVRKGE